VNFGGRIFTLRVQIFLEKVVLKSANSRKICNFFEKIAKVLRTQNSKKTKPLESRPVFFYIKNCFRNFWPFFPNSFCSHSAIKKIAKKKPLSSLESLPASGTICLGNLLCSQSGYHL
jgi:hypothetical protein